MSRKPKNRSMSLADAMREWQACPPELRAVVLLDIANGAGRMNASAAKSRAQIVPDFAAHAARMDLAASAYEAANAILQLATSFPVDKDEAPESER